MVWQLRTILLSIAVIAATLALFRAFWEPLKTNHDLLLGLYLVVLSACAVASIRRTASFHGGLLGTLLFGVAYLICSLQAGFGLETIYDSQALARNAILGLALLGVAFLTSQLLTSVVWPCASRNGDNLDKQSDKRAD